MKYKQILITKYVHLRLLPHILRRLVNSAGQIKLSNQPNNRNNIGDEASKMVVSSNVRNNLTPRTYTQFELSAKINIFLPFGVAFNSLLSVTSVNLTGSEHAGTEDSASTLAVFDSYSDISSSGQQLFRIFPLRGSPKSLGITFHAVDK